MSLTYLLTYLHGSYSDTIGNLSIRKTSRQTKTQSNQIKQIS